MISMRCFVQFNHFFDQAGDHLYLESIEGSWRNEYESNLSRALSVFDTKNRDKNT